MDKEPKCYCDYEAWIKYGKHAPGCIYKKWNDRRMRKLYNEMFGVPESEEEDDYWTNRGSDEADTQDLSDLF